MSASVSSVASGEVVFSLTFDVGLTVCPARVCFGSPTGGVGCGRLTGGSVVCQACLLILISSSEVADLDEKASFSVSDSWISTKIGFPSKSGKAEYLFAAVSLKICKSLTLMTLFYSSTWTL